MAHKTRIKICGLTCEQDIDAVCMANVDMIGMVLFYPRSKRNVTVEQARYLLQYLKQKNTTIQTVAVVVSPQKEQLFEIAGLGFDYIQIHGEWERTEVPIPILRAINVDGLLQNHTIGNDFYGIVFDGKNPGSGMTFDWSVLQQFQRNHNMLILAGGLTNENVADAISMVKPDVVDVSSYVEDETGCRKDPEKIKHFVEAVRKTDMEEM